MSIKQQFSGLGAGDGPGLTRRAFAAAAAASLTGCMGYRVEEAEAVEARKARIEELSSRANASEERATRLEDRVSRLNGTVEEQEAELEEQREQLREQRAEHLAALYELGVEYQQFGAGAWGNALDAADSGDRGLSAEYFGRAYANYNNSGDAFSAAEDYALENDIDPGGVVGDALSYVGHMKEAALAYENAMGYYADGANGTADDYYSQGRSQYNAAQQYEVRGVDELRSRLDFEGAVGGGTPI